MNAPTGDDKRLFSEEDTVTLLVLSCGRPKLLRRTLNSFDRMYGKYISARYA